MWLIQLCMGLTHQYLWLVTWTAFVTSIWEGFMLIGQICCVGSETTSFYVSALMYVSEVMCT
jgi:hypothetical protein